MSISASYKRTFAKANRFRRCGDSRRAMAILRTLMRDFPDKAAAYVVLGDILWEAGELKKAARAFRVATERFPKLEIASKGLFHTLWDQAETDAALNELGRFQSVAFSQDYADILDDILHPKKAKGSKPKASHRNDLVPAAIRYCIGNDFTLGQVIELYQASTLGERRPIHDRRRMATMLKNANLIVTAWDRRRIVGIARALTDFAYVTYLSDLAVRASYQRMGIGKELMRRTQAAAPRAKIVLLAAPAAEKYYPHVGFTHHPQAWLLEPQEQVR